MKKIRLPRKVKKLLKKDSPKEWMNFLQKRAEFIQREINLDLIFKRNYENSRKIFYEIIDRG